MTAQSKATLKTYFETGDYPTENQFGDLVDSFDDFGSASARKMLTDYANAVVVDAGGNGDYSTQAAAAAAITDDSGSKIYNVFVFGEAVTPATWAGRPYIRVHGAKYKAYRALLTQTSNTAPVATVLENSIGSIVWTRDNVGLYTATLSGAFAFAKTLVSVELSGSTGTMADVARIYKAVDGNSILLITYRNGSAADALLTGASIEIKVFF